MNALSRIIAIFVFLASAANVSRADDYGKEMRNALKSCYGADFSKYQFLGTPVSNFGTGTMYPKAATQKDFDIKTAGLYGNPQNWWNPEYKAQKDALLADLAPPAKTGVTTCNLNLTKTFSLDAIFPSLYKMLTLNGKFDYKKNVQVKITADDVENDLLDWSVLSDYIKPPAKIKPSVLAHIDANDYVITIGDIVITKYSAKLVVSKSISADAQAKLTQAWKQFGANSGLDGSFSGGDNGDYSMTANSPVVAAVYVNAPPPGGIRDKTAPLWVPARLSQRTVQDIQTTNQTVIKSE
jgi:hypothetical protein